jgi:hypothetical protein
MQAGATGTFSIRPVKKNERQTELFDDLCIEARHKGKISLPILRL